MKSLQFKLNNCLFAPDPHAGDSPTAKYLVPTLPAYALEYAELIVEPDLNGVQQTRMFLDRGFEINEDIVLWHSYRQALFGPQVPILVIHYHGIRDYRLLFPALSTPERVQRLANYYEEADKTFEAGAWLSFMLMCGAVFEGLLFDRIGTDKLSKFNQLIDRSAKSDLITSSEQVLMHSIRSYRNMVHLDNKLDTYVSRKDVMDVRKALDSIVQRFSYQ